MTDKERYNTKLSKKEAFLAKTGNTTEGFLSERLGFWCRLSEEEKNIIINSVLELRYSAGAVLDTSERECIGVLIIKSGSLRISLISEEGKEITLYRIKADDVCIFSASCVLKHIDMKITIRAEENCSIVSIPSDIFSKIIESNVYVECFSYKAASARLSDVMWVLQQRLFRRLDSRMAGFILEKQNLVSSGVIRATHEQLGIELGTSREVVTRMLGSFAEDGLIELSRGSIKVINSGGLKALL